MGFEFGGFDELAGGLTKVIRSRGKRQLRLQKGMADFFFDACKAGNYQDDEGKLRASFEDGNPDQVKEIFWDQMELGTRVYYAVMVEEGHVIGVRGKRHNHRGKRSGKVKGAYTVNKGFAPGVFFMQEAMDKLDGQLPEMADKLLQDIGREAGLV